MAAETDARAGSIAFAAVDYIADVAPVRSAVATLCGTSSSFGLTTFGMASHTA